MRKRPETLPERWVSGLASVFETAVLAGAVALAAFFVSHRSDAASGLCAGGTQCERPLRDKADEKRAHRYETALQRVAGADASVRRVALSDQDYATFSGIGVIVCSVDGETRSSTAFLVGAFDIGVTVAHTFGNPAAGASARDCVYNSADALGQIRERIPVSYVKSQWDAEAGAYGEPAKDLAVVRLSHSSRYAQRTMPLGRFSGDAAPVVMVGFRSDIASDTVKRKARGTAYERTADRAALPGLVDFTHDMDAHGIAPGAPVIDERSGVIIGIHMRLPTDRNVMLTMNDWLETTLRSEMRSQTELQDKTQAQARPN